VSRSRKLRARQPDLVQARGERRLLVWAGAGAWVVGDAEFEDLIRALDGRSRPERVVHELARRWGRPAQAVAADVGQAIDLLRSMGVIGRVRPIEDALSIANVTVNATNRCNLRCTHCYNPVDRAEASAGELVAALRSAASLLEEGASLIVLGGEPLLDMDRLDTLVRDTAHLFGVATMVSTNGTLVTPEVARRLAELEVDVQVSLDGPTAAVNDPVRGGGSFGKATLGVRTLVDAGVGVTLSMVYDRDNLAQMEAYADLALALGASQVRFIPLRLIGRAAAEPERAPDQAAALDHVLALLARRPELRPLLQRDFFSITREVCRRGGARTNCGIGRKVVFLDADGAVYPCPNHRGEPWRCGDATVESMADILRRSPVMKHVRRDYEVGRYDDCRTCEVRPWCAGDCRGEVVARDGAARGPAPHCDEMRRLVPRLMWLIADGDERLGDAGSGSRFL